MTQTSFFRCSRTLWLLFLAPLTMIGAEPKISGLHFTLGQPLDKPAARVSIAEISNGAQRRGFLRIAILPLVVAKGLDIRFQRPELAALAEVQEMLRSLVKLEAQEFHDVRFFAGADPVPRLLASEATPMADHWKLKKVRVRVGGAFLEITECALYFAGPEAGRISKPGALEELRLDLELPQP